MGANAEHGKVVWVKFSVGKSVKGWLMGRLPKGRIQLGRWTGLQLRSVVSNRTTERRMLRLSRLGMWAQKRKKEEKSCMAKKMTLDSAMCGRQKSGQARMAKDRKMGTGRLLRKAKSEKLPKTGRIMGRG